MNKKSLKVLEFNKITDMLAKKCVSPMGKEVAEKLTPVSDIDEIRRMQAETTEAVAFILRKGSLPLGGIRDIRASLKRANVGGVLSVEELLHVSDFVYVSRKIKTYAERLDKREAYEILDPAFDGVVVCGALERKINGCIENNLEISDDATPQLKEIRNGIKAANVKIREQLNGIIHSQAYKNMLQDAVITIRNDRYCVPVKQEYRNSFQGMVHDQSQSGATIFVEPMSVVQLNNKIKELKSKEQAEIEKILRTLSQSVAENNDDLYANIEIITYLDFVFAKGELSVSINGTEPKFNEKLFIDVKKARHPLLDRNKVVPIDVYLGGEFSALLITGPNTGGKTVCLKTLGLFVLMGQAGLHISAFDNSELGVFDEVFADIGDEQSIEQSLSTFSSHMSNIVKIVDAATPFSLVLLDELGAGTDPTEGAALAVSIIDYLLKRRIRTAVTTHYSELKVYAISTDGVTNASCEFDVETLKPTYRLLIGVPGKSNAFAISEKLGLPDEIIDGAKEFISHEDVRFEDIITDLEMSRKTVIVEKDRAEQFRRDAERLKKEFEAQKLKLAEQKEKILLKAREEAREILWNAKEESDSLIKEIKNSATVQDAEKTRQAIREKLSSAEDDAAKPVASREEPKNLVKGSLIYIHSMNQKAVVINPPDVSGEVLVQAGIMKIKVNISDLSAVKEEQPADKNRGWSTSVKSAKSRTATTEIDLRGCMTEEGVEKCDKFLDDATMSGLEQVFVIHGKGTGALRAAIHNRLKRHPHVKEYRLGRFGEGEAGVTVVTLK